MNNLTLILSLIIVTNLFLIKYFNKIKIFHYIIDKPDNVRKFHSTPVPLAGGIIIFINILIYSIIILTNQEYFLKELIFDSTTDACGFFLAIVLIFIIGYLDDKYDLSPNLKFVLLTIVIIVILNFDENLAIKEIRFSFNKDTFNIEPFSLLFTCFCFLVFLNAFNMFDGINLQSSIYSIIIFFSLSIFLTNSILIDVMLITLLGYSYLNYKNITFLGDSGALVLAFIISYSFIKTYNLGLITYTDEIFIYMMIPGVDLIRLFFKRVLQKKNPLKSDRQHLHHLLCLKFTNMQSLIILQSIIIFPILLNSLSLNKVAIIVFTIILYTILIIQLEDNKKNNINL